MVEVAGVVDLADERVAVLPDPQGPSAAAVEEAVAGDFVDHQDDVFGAARAQAGGDGKAGHERPQLAERSAAKFKQDGLARLRQCLVA